MASTAGRRQDHGSLVVSLNLTSTMKTLFKLKSELSHINNLINTLPGPQEIVKKFGQGTYSPIRRLRTPQVRMGGECYKALARWATGKRLTDRLPKLNLITPPLLNSGVLGLCMRLYVPCPKFSTISGGPGRVFIRFLT